MNRKVVTAVAAAVFMTESLRPEVKPTEVPEQVISQAETQPAEAELPPAVEEQAVSLPLPVVTYYTADYCPPCKAYGPLLDSIAEFRVERVENPTTDQVPSIPCIEYQGRRLFGARTIEEVLAWFHEGVAAGGSAEMSTVTVVETSDGALGTGTCLRELGGNRYLFAVCAHQVAGEGYEFDEVRLLGTTGKVLWHREDGIDDAAIVLVETGKDVQAGRIFDGDYRGPATVFGYGDDDNPDLDRFSGTIRDCEVHGLELSGPVPPFGREGMSGGGAYAPSGELVGIFYAYASKAPQVNYFTPISVYMDAIESLGGITTTAPPPAVSAAPAGLPDAGISGAAFSTEGQGGER